MKAATESPAPDVAVQDECVPADEADRLASLHRLGLLDTEPSEGFDAVARVAAAALRVPIVLVSLVDSERLWFKARAGLGVRECPRQSSFCAQAVFQRDPLSVRDAAEDPRFAKFALVSGAPHVRSYLGIPLYSSDRQPVGTLCAMDTQAREFGERRSGRIARIGADRRRAPVRQAARAENRRRPAICDGAREAVSRDFRTGRGRHRAYLAARHDPAHQSTGLRDAGLQRWRSCAS